MHRLEGGSSFSTPLPSRSSDVREEGDFGVISLSEGDKRASCSTPLRSRLKRATQKASSLIETAMLLPRDALQLLGESALKKNRVFLRLWSYLERSKTDEKYIIAAKNAIMALNLIGFSFSGRDLSGVNIPGANLSYGLFQRANFSNANLEGVNFQYAHLENVLFINANLDKADFGQFLLKDLDSTQTGNCLAVYRDPFSGQTIVAVGDKLKGSLEKNTKIHLWSLERRKRISTCDSGRGSIESLAFTPDGERLISANGEGGLDVWDVETGILINTVYLSYILKKNIENRFSKSRLEELLMYCPQIKNVVDYPDYIEVNLGIETYRWCVYNNLLEMFEFISEKVQIVGCSVSPNQSAPLIACTNRNRDIYVWDLNENRLISFIAGEKANDKPYFTSNENHLIIPCKKSIKLFDLTTKKNIRIWSSPLPTYSGTTFSADGKLLAAIGVAEGVVIWSFNDENPNKIFSLFIKDNPELPEIPRSVAFSEDSKLIAVGFRREIQVWDTRDWKLMYHWGGLNYDITALEFGDQDRVLISVSAGEDTKVWKLSEPIGTKSDTHPFSIESIKVSAYAGMLFSYSRHELKIWNASSGEHVHTLNGKFLHCSASGDGRHLLRLTKNRGVLWDIKTKTEKMVFERAGGIQGGGFLWKGCPFIVSAERIEVYDFESQKFNAYLEGRIKNLADCALSDNRRWLAMSFQDGSLGAWDAVSENYYFIENAHPSNISSIKFSGDNIISISAFHVHIWNPTEGVRSQLKNLDDVWTISSFPDKILIKCGGFLKLYSREGRSYHFMHQIGSCCEQTLLKFRGHNDSRSINLTDDWGRTKTWFEEEGVLSSDWDDVLSLSTLAFHHPSSILAIGGKNGTIQIWNPIKNRLLHVLRGHTKKVVDLNFSEDGCNLFSSSEDRIIQCWDLSPDLTTVTLRWRAGPHTLVLHGVQTYGANLDIGNCSILLQESTKLDAGLVLARLLKNDKNYVCRPHVLPPGDESEYFSEIEVKSYNLDSAIMLIHQKILRKEEKIPFLQALLENIDNLKDLVPSSFCYILNAIHPFAQSLYDETAIHPVFHTILSIISNNPAPDQHRFERDLLDSLVCSIIRRMISLSEEAVISNASYEVYNEAAAIFFRERNEMNAIDCYHRSLKINPQQPEILYQISLLWFKRGVKEDGLNAMIEAQRLGYEFPSEVAAMIEENKPSSSSKR